MAKVTLNNVASGYNRSKINTNFADIQLELNNKVLYRDNPEGEPNSMENDLDMNSNNINNVAPATQNTQAVNFEQFTIALDAVNGVDLTALEAALAAVEADTSTNTASITTNTNDITTNTNNISTNTADIATNTADIATNTADIITLRSSTIYALPSTASMDFDPDNGNIQVLDMSEDGTLVDSFVNGQSVTLMVSANSFTLTFPLVGWVGGTAPTLATSGTSVVEFWKVNDVLYGASVGDVAVPVPPGWSLVDAVYAGLSYATGAGANQLGLSFKTDGTKMYITEITTDEVWQFSLSTAWDVTTATDDLTRFSAPAPPASVQFKPDGTKMFILVTGAAGVYDYNLSTPWDIGTATWTGNSSATSGQDISPLSFFFKDDGTTMYVLGAENDLVYQYALSTPWDISTSAYDFSSSVTTPSASPRGISFKDDGTKMFISDNALDAVFEFDLTTAWDLSTVTYNSVGLDISTQSGNVRDIYIRPDDGLLLTILDLSAQSVYQYTLT